MNPDYTCPQCGAHTFKLSIIQSVDVEFQNDGEFDIGDGGYGDIEWDRDSIAECIKCQWYGSLKDAKSANDELQAHQAVTS